MREFFLTNAQYWIQEFHLDGLRLDATQQIFDDSPEHILAAITKRVRETAGTRGTILIAENEPQDVRLLRAPERGGFGLDALWNDDFHHTAHVALTGQNEAYYSDHRGSPQEFISAAKWGFLFQGQYYAWQKQRRGTPVLDIEPAHFVNFLDNHDQIANSGRGDRIHSLTNPGLYRALTTLLLLAPNTPMLFMGQEYAAAQPFLYFADNEPELAASVLKGRIDSLRQFPSLAYERFLTEGPSDRLFIVNLGHDLTMVPAPEPLLGPPEGYEWIIYWSSENPDYRGGGISPVAEDDGAWQIPGHGGNRVRSFSHRGNLELSLSSGIHLSNQAVSSGCRRNSRRLRGVTMYG